MGAIGLYSDSSEPASKGMTHVTRIEMQSILGNIFDEWEPSSMSWPINYGEKIASGAAAIAGPLFTNRFRNLFGMRTDRSRIMTIAISIFAPAATAAVLHNELIKKDIMLQDTKCPVCLETRSASIQLGAGCILPLVLSYFGTITFALTQNYRFVPKGASNWLNFTRSTMSKVFPLIVGVSIFQAVVAAGLVALEVDSREKVLKELDRRMGFEENLEAPVEFQ